MMELNRIIVGNCIELMSKMETNSFDMVFADPPSNIADYYYEEEHSNKFGSLKSVYDSLNNEGSILPNEYIEFTEQWVSKAIRVLKKDGSIYIMCNSNNVAELILILKKHKLTFVNLITWQMTNRNVSSSSNKNFDNTCEYVLLFSKGENRVFNYESIKKTNCKKYKNSYYDDPTQNIWRIPVAQSEQKHYLDQKPEELIRRAVIASTNYGSVILDPFCRTGTTCIVAMKNDRNYVGITSNKEYLKLAKKRIISARQQINKTYKKGQVDLFIQPV